jgi:hypothetical protein
MEFKLRFDTTRQAFNNSIEIYQQNPQELDQLKVFFFQFSNSKISRVSFRIFKMN